MTYPFNRFRIATAAISGVLVACGGGGGSDTTDGGGASTPPVSTATSITLTGIAAVGAPIVGQTVNVRCAAGSGSAVTGGDGGYTVTIASAAWPCAAQVTATSGQVLTSVATSSSASAIANLTPASHLVVAALAATDPVAWFPSFGAGSAAAVTTASIASAQTQVIATLKSAGVDFSPIGDLLGSAFSTAYDNLLIAFGSRLSSSGTTLAALATTVATTAATPSAVSIASELLLQPAASSCAALRSTTYRLLTPSGTGALSTQTGLWSIDATTLRVSRANGTTGTWVANGACRYSEQTGAYAADVTVSPAGVLVGRYTNDGTTYRLLIGFPEQTHTLAELAGNWNVLGMARSTNASYAPTAGVATYDGSGRLTAATQCQNTATWAIDTCVSVPAAALAAASPLAVDSAGGFDATDVNTGAVTSRFFAFKAGSGDLMLAAVSNTGELFLETPVRTAPLPAVGQVTTSWNFEATAALLSASPNYQTRATVSSVNTGAGSYQRTQTLVATSVSYSETIVLNSPSAGYRVRPQANVTGSDGNPRTVLALQGLSLSGMGVLPLTLTSTAGVRLFEIAVAAP